MEKGRAHLSALAVNNRDSFEVVLYCICIIYL